jgi:hypothetical protein
MKPVRLLPQLDQTKLQARRTSKLSSGREQPHRRYSDLRHRLEEDERSTCVTASRLITRLSGIMPTMCNGRPTEANCCSTAIAAKT